MNQESRRILALLACLAVASCEAVPVDPGLIEGPADGLAHHRPDHTGGGGGGGGEDPPADGFTLTMTGAIVTGPVATTMEGETKRSLDLAIPSAEFAMTATHAAALDEISDPTSNTVCEYRPESMSQDTKEALASELVAQRGYGRLVVNKFKDLGNVVYNQPTDGRHWTSWGFNTQTDGQQAADVTYDGTDKQNASITRKFRLNGGVIRVLDPDIGDLVCNVQDEMLAVVAPGTP